MKTILACSSIFTNDKLSPFYDEGAVLIDDGIVRQVGPAKIIKLDNPGTPVENIDQGLLTPGLVNLHHHLYSSFARGWAPKGSSPSNFKEILERIWWPLDEGLNLDDIYYSALIGLSQSILSGVTSVVDHHSSQRTIKSSLDKVASAFEMIGLRGSVCFELSNRGGEKAFSSGLKESVDALSKWPFGGKKSSLTALIGMHASMTLSNENLIAITDATKTYSPGYHFHLAEDSVDQKISLEKYGHRAAERFAQYGLLNDRSLAVHGVHLDKKEIAILNSANTNLALCARSNQNNAVGFARWWDYDDLSIGLGTDGIGSDMLHEAKAALYLSRHEKGDPYFGFGQIGEMLLEQNPAIFERITGMTVGRIAPGYPADLVFWHYNPPTPLNAGNIIGHYLYGLCDLPADSVWVDGNKVLSNGKFSNFNYDGMLSEARKLAKSLWERI
jgi:putative selenium metabolism protein SsnA